MVLKIRCKVEQVDLVREVTIINMDRYSQDPKKDSKKHTLLDDFCTLLNYPPNMDENEMLFSII